MQKKTWIATGVLAASLAVSGMAHAENWIFRIGGHYVDPKGDNHPIVSVDSGQSLTFSLTRMLSPNWGVELLAALPFEHDIALRANGAKGADVKHLPPTLTLQYHFVEQGNVRPYVGVGLNGTIFFSEDTTGPLAGTDLSLDTSFGLAAQLGVDIDLGRTWFLGLDARWFDIDTDATLSGTDLGEVAIDPYALGVTLGRRF